MIIYCSRNSLALFSIVVLFILCNIPRLGLNLVEWELRSTLQDDVTDSDQICESSR